MRAGLRLLSAEIQFKQGHVEQALKQLKTVLPKWVVLLSGVLGGGVSGFWPTPPVRNVLLCWCWCSHCLLLVQLVISCFFHQQYSKLTPCICYNIVMCLLACQINASTSAAWRCCLLTARHASA